MQAEELTQELRLASATPQLPHNVEAEYAVIGGILIDPTAIARAQQILKPEYFYLQPNRLIFEAASAVHNDKNPVDLISVATKLLEQGQLKAAGGQGGLAQLVDQVVSAVNIDAHCELIKDKWRRREWIAIARRMTLQGYDLATPWTQVVSEGEAQLYQFLTTEQSQKGIQHISEYCHREMDRIAEAEAGGQIVKALSTGFWDLDALTHGAPEEELIIIAGRPAMGKTSFVLRLARNVAAHRPVAVFSLEMSGDRLARRLWSAESRITPGHLAQSPNLREPAIAGIGQVAGMNIWIGEFNTEIEAICTNARRLAAEQGQLGAIAIDYLGLIDLPAAGNEASALGKITRRMKLLAVELKTTIFLLHQLSRAPESRTNKRPQLSDLRDSGKIEQDADQVLFMYRDEYYHPDTPDRGIAEIIVAKNRNGPIGTVKLLFEPQFTDFKNVARWSG